MAPVPHELTDADLLSRHVAGDPEAFGQLAGRHRQRLWSVALRTLGDEEEAADALQDALVSAFRKAGSFRGDAAVTTWLHRIVVNASLDRARRRSVHAAVPLPEYTERHAPPSVDPVAGREEACDVTAALARLPVEQRAALVLVDMAGYSVNEAARILEIAPGTVKSRCARGRARLVPLLTEPAEAASSPSPPSSPSHSSSPAPPGNQSTRSPVPSRREREDADEGGEIRS